MEAPSDRTRVRRKGQRGAYDSATIHAIVDEALICHVGFVDDGYPVVIPTIHARVGDTLYFHGSPASRMLRTMKHGAQVCVTVTLLDGIVLAKSHFNSSMNYRSVVTFGEARLVDDPDEAEAGYRAITEKMQTGRWDAARQPSESELRATLLLAVPLHESSAKVRTGGPVDEEADVDLPHWSGVIPVELQRGPAQEA